MSTTIDTPTEVADGNPLTDVINRDGWYSSGDAARLLGIPAASIENARRSVPLAFRANPAGGVLVSGRDILAWVKKTGVECKPLEPSIDASTLTLEDVVDAGRWYSPSDVEWSLSIPASAVQAAQKEFRGKYFCQSRGGNSSVLIGRELLSWICCEKVPWTVSPLAADHYARRLKAAMPPTPPPTNILIEARALTAERKRQAAEAAAVEDDAAIGKYTALLRRFEEPEETDADELAELLEKFTLTDSQVLEDQKIIGKVDRLAQRPHDRQTIRQAWGHAARGGWLFQEDRGRNSFPEFRGD